MRARCPSLRRGRTWWSCARGGRGCGLGARNGPLHTLTHGSTRLRTYRRPERRHYRLWRCNRGPRCWPGRGRDSSPCSRRRSFRGRGRGLRCWREGLTTARGDGGGRHGFRCGSGRLGRSGLGCCGSAGASSLLQRGRSRTCRSFREGNGGLGSGWCGLDGARPKRARVDDLRQHGTDSG